MRPTKEPLTLYVLAFSRHHDPRRTEPTHAVHPFHEIEHLLSQRQSVAAEIPDGSDICMPPADRVFVGHCLACPSVCVVLDALTEPAPRAAHLWRIGMLSAGTRLPLLLPRVPPGVRAGQ